MKTAPPSTVGVEECCQRPVLHTAATNIEALRFYLREGQIGTIVGFANPLERVL